MREETGLQYRVFLTKVGVRVVERNEQWVFLRTPAGEIFIVSEVQIEIHPESGFIRWLTEWVDF